MTKLKDLNLDRHNANKGSAKGQKLIVGSIQRNGFGRSGLLDAKGNVIAGNKTTEAAAEVFGVEAEPIIIETDGKRPVYVKRTDLNLDDPDPNNPARRLAYEDNLTSHFSFELDPSIVMADIEAGFDFEAIDITIPDLGSMLKGAAAELLRKNGAGRDVEPQIDKAQQLKEKWGVELGQLWQLGEHRLICGDCTDKATVERVMRGERARLEFSDPPYEFETRGGGIREDAAHMDAIERAGINTFDPLSLTLLAVTSVFCCNKTLIPSYIELAKSNNQSWDLCFYKKENTPPNFGGHLMTDTEYLPVIGKQGPNRGMEKEVYSKGYIGGLDDGHLVAWQKPVKLVEKFVRLFSNYQDIILDRFVCSGTTLIACENLNRRCRAIEIDPGYVAVSLQRWADLTGKTPQLLENLES